VAGDAINSLRADAVFKDGEGYSFNGNPNRWGDYSSTVVDPVNDLDIWTIQEFAGKPDDPFQKWGTWWKRVVFAP
jgi:hypothetical protein